MTFYDFLIRHFKKRKKSCFLKSEKNEKYVFSKDTTNKHSLPWQRPLGDRKTNLRLIIYSPISTNPAKIGQVQVDIEIIGLTEIVKIYNIK